MSSAGPFYPGTTNNDGLSGTPWVSPENAKVEDGSVAAVAAAGSSQYLLCSGFSFSIPAGATINGILVEVKHAGTGLGDVHDGNVRLLRALTLQSTDKASGTPWPASLTYASYGGPADTWGDTWTDSQINDSGFGVGIAAQGSFDTGTIDAVRITVTYTAGASAPTVTDTSPSTGSTAGGTAITLTGTDFTGATDVSVGGVSCSSLVVVGPTSITCTTGAHAAGTVDVVVTTGEGAGTQTNGFTYQAPAPTVSDVSPALGSLSAGTPITITGTGFVATPTVTLGGVSATSVVFGSSTSLTCKTPVQSSGQKTVQVINPDAQSGSLPNAFRARASKSMRPYANT